MCKIGQFAKGYHAFVSWWISYFKLENKSQKKNVGQLSNVSNRNGSIARSSVLVRPCLGTFSLIVLTFLPSILLTALLLLFWCLLPPLISPLLFPCARYLVWNTYLVHGIHYPHSQCCIVSCLSLFATSSQRIKTALCLVYNNIIWILILYINWNI